MKRWIGSLLQNKGRRLELSAGGRWYLVFTVVLGAVAINSGNNVIYFLESLLLSALILSGILSEQTLVRVSVERVLGNAAAGEAAGDLLLVRNRTRLPLYCVEICEWRGKELRPLAFVLFLPGRALVRVRSRQTLRERGVWSWDGLAVATSFPFGFARKIRFLPAPGRRIVWPDLSEAARAGEGEKEGRRGDPEFVAGEVEELGSSVDLSRVHWPSSARAGALLARPQRALSPSEEVSLDLCPPGEELEYRIRRAASALARAKERSTLVMREGRGRTEISGKNRALDTLALLPKGEPGA